MQQAVYVVIAYLIGSIPIGVMLARLKGKDPRKTGSGNIGATNVMRTAGRALGIVTLFGDIAKGFLPTFIAIRCGMPKEVVAVIGFATFVGHLFPVFLKFRGGKGVATALGVYLAVGPIAIIPCFVVFVAILLIWRYVSLGSLAGAGIVPFAMYALKVPVEYVLLAFVIAAFVFIKHKDNIRRLIKGQENKIKFR
ncbi:MAG TPA: glycerol-3-phosphate 1-O-acyltransferase PlsY [Syntrophorhabdaceae bacterium]|nr:glycerol-3-phosphate 1-O-acyltransferase PlsY [Syntrophorhabdaceae bacterium]